MQEIKNQPITNSSETKALRKKQQQPQCLRLQNRDNLELAEKVSGSKKRPFLLNMRLFQQNLDR